MPDFERLYVKIIGDSNLGKTLAKDTAALTAFQKKLDSIFGKYKDQKVTVEVDEDGASATISQLGEVDAAAKAVDNKVTVDVDADTGGAIADLGAVEVAAKAVDNHVPINVDVDAGSAIAKLGAVNAALVGTGGASVASGLSQISTASGPAFGAAIVAAAGVAVAALQPLVGGAAIGGSMVASVAAGFGLMALAGKEAFGRMEQVNGRFVAKTAQDANSSIGKMANYLNRVVDSYQQAIKPASYAAASLAADVLRVANKTLPALGRAATQTTQQVHGAVNDVLISASTGQEVQAYKRFLAGIPGITAALTKAAGNFFLGVVNIISAATPFARKLANAIGDIASSFLKWTNSKAGREAMQRFFISASNIIPKVARAAAFLVKKLFDVSNAIMDIFDLNQARLNKSAHQSATGYVGEWQKTLSAQADKQKGEGSAAYEFGYKVGHAISAGLQGSKQEGLVHQLLIGGGKNSPAAIGNEAGRGFRQGLATFLGKHPVKNINELIWGKDGYKRLVAFGKKIGRAQNTAVQAAIKRTRQLYEGLRKDLGNIWSTMGGLAHKWWTRVSKNVVQSSDQAKSGSGDRFRDLQRNLGNLWDKTSGLANKWWTRVSKNVVKNSDEAKSGSGNKFRDLWRNLGNIWGDTLRAAGNLWNDISKKIVNQSQDAKSGAGTAFKNLMQNASNIWQDTANVAKKVWTGISSTIRGLAWDIYHGVSSAWNKLESFVKGVLSRLGITGGDSSSSGGTSGGGSSSGGSSSGGNGTFIPVGKARGGLEDGKYHGMARGGITDQPRILYGEAGPEAYVRLNQYTPESAEALTKANEIWNRKGWLDRARRQGTMAKMAAGRGSHNAGGRYGDGYSVSPITHHKWAPEITGRVHDIAAATGTVPNTYPGHGEPGGSSELYTADFWGKGGRGSPIPKAMGYKTADLALSKYNHDPGVLYIIRQGRYWRGGQWSGNTYGDPHYDHTHISWDSPGGAKAGAAGYSGPSPEEILFDKLWGATAQPLLDRFSNSMQGGFVLRQAGAALSTNAGNSVHDWILAKIRSIFGGSADGGSMTDFTGSGMELMKKSLDKYNLPADWATSSDLWNIARSESGTTPQNVKFQPNGPTFMAPWGIHVPYLGVSPSSPSFERFALGPRYVKNQYGTPEKAWAFHQSHNPPWYQSGGVVPGQKGKKVLIQAHGGERVLPQEVVRSFDHLATSVERWAQRGRKSIGNLDHKAQDAIHDAVKNMHHEVVSELKDQKQRMLHAEDLLQMALRVQDSPAGVKGTERRVKRIINRELARVGGD